MFHTRIHNETILKGHLNNMAPYSLVLHNSVKLCETSLTCLAVPRVQGGVNNPVMRSVKSDTGDDCTATGVERVTPFSDWADCLLLMNIDDDAAVQENHVFKVMF